MEPKPLKSLRNDGTRFVLALGHRRWRFRKRQLFQEVREIGLPVPQMREDLPSAWAVRPTKVRLGRAHFFIPFGIGNAKVS